MFKNLTEGMESMVMDLDHLRENSKRREENSKPGSW